MNSIKPDGYGGQLNFNARNPEESIIEINANIFQKFEDVMKKSPYDFEKQAALVAVTSIIFHEYTHYGDALDGFSATKDNNGNISNGSGDSYYFGNFGRQGDNFEEGYGTDYDIWGQRLDRNYPGTFLQIKQRRVEGKSTYNIVPELQNSKESQNVTPSEIDPSVLPTVPSK